MSVSDIPFEFSKIFIEQKNYSKQKLLSCIFHMLSIRDEFIKNILNSISKNNFYKDDKIYVFCISNYLYTIAMNVFTILFKNNSDCKVVNDYFLEKIPAINIYGESLVNISVGILFTECLDLINKINNDDLTLFALEFYDVINDLYLNQFDIIGNEFILNANNEKEYINKFENAFINYKDKILIYLESFGNKEITEMKNEINNDITNIINDIK
jgi:hypothetical protein